MRLYLTAKTSIPDLFIDYIQVKLKSGEEVSLNWDYSDEVMDFVDDDKQLVFSPPELIREGCVTVG